MQPSHQGPQSPLSKNKAYAQSASSLQFMNSQSKVTLPSRYALDKKLQKSGFHDILNQIESATKNQNAGTLASPKKGKAMKTIELIGDASKKTKNMEFKTKPMKRQESDQQHFNEIFLNPRKQALHQIQKLGKTEQVKTISKQYDKLVKFEGGSTLKTEETVPQDKEQIHQNYQECIDMLESGDLFGLHIQNSKIDFYEDQISMEPPEFPSPNSASLGMNSALPSSIPSNVKSIKNSSIKELLMRAKAGTNTEDIEKEAHLAYYIGELYCTGSKKNYKQGLKFFRRFLGFAKAMQDKIGMCLGANRVGVCCHECGDISKSILFHNQNLKLSDSENCFVGFYNLGICYRNQNKLQQALQYFESCLSWAQEKGEQQSECLAYGQLGLTYQKMQLYQESIEHYEKSLEICHKIKKIELKFHNLRAILRVSSQFNLKPLPALHQIAEQAYQCTTILLNNPSNTSLGSVVTMQDIMRCNIGILKGMEQFQSYRQCREEQQSCMQCEELQQ